MKKLVIIMAAVALCGCNNAKRMFDSEIAAIRDQTKVLEKIEHHLAVIASHMESEVSND